MNHGTVYWLTGLSGSGKTTIGKALFDLVRSKKPHIVFLDGDTMRETIAEDVGFSLDERKKCGMRYGRLCNMLASQGIDVVCATISMFPECWTWNRNNIPNYKEVYIRVPIETLKRRDPKGIYERVFKGELKEVVGVDLSVSEPDAPHCVIENDGTRTPEKIALELCERLGIVL